MAADLPKPPTAPLRELKLCVPTYNGKYYAARIAAETMPEFGAPHVPVVVQEADGLRIILGDDNAEHPEAPEICIERQPLGWIIFLNTVPGGDGAGTVHILDDGRTFAMRECAPGYTCATPQIEMAEHVPETEGLQPKQKDEDDG